MKKIVDGLSYNKMNIFHWHITDTHSFPLKLKSVPELAQYGAYSQEKTYSASDVKELVEYARGRFSEQLINYYLKELTTSKNKLSL